MPRNCVVWGCNKTSDDLSVSFFKFPCGIYRKHWIRFVRRSRKDVKAPVISHGKYIMFTYRSGASKQIVFSRHFMLDYDTNFVQYTIVIVGLIRPHVIMQSCVEYFIPISSSRPPNSVSRSPIYLYFR